MTNYLLFKRTSQWGAIVLLLMLIALVVPQVFASSTADKIDPYKSFKFTVHTTAVYCENNTAVARLSGTLYQVQTDETVKIGQYTATVQHQPASNNVGGGEIIVVDLVGPAALADGNGSDIGIILFNIVDGVTVTQSGDNALGGGDIILIDLVGAAASADDGGQLSGGGDFILVDVVGASITGPAVFTTDPCAETAVSQSERTVFYQYPWQVSLSG